MAGPGGLPGRDAGGGGRGRGGGRSGGDGGCGGGTCGAGGGGCGGGGDAATSDGITPLDTATAPGTFARASDSATVLLAASTLSAAVALALLYVLMTTPSLVPRVTDTELGTTLAPRPVSAEAMLLVPLLAAVFSAVATLAAVPVSETLPTTKEMGMVVVCSSWRWRPMVLAAFGGGGDQGG